MRDMFAEEDLGTFTGSWTGSVYVHDVRAVRITPLRSQPHHRQVHGCVNLSTCFVLPILAVKDHPC